MKFSTNWKSSTKPKKQRKYRLNAPLHIKSRFLHAHLSDELSKKYKKRSLKIRVGDRVKIMKGQFKQKSGKVEKILTSKSKAYIEGAEYQKKDGTKIKYPIDPANLMITELNVADKKRQELLKRE
jgi:large subunit ribosomal protein L24